MGKTAVQKILERAAGRGVRVGEIVDVTPDLLVPVDLLFPHLLADLASVGVTRLAAPEKVVVVLDHVNPPDAKTAELYRQLRETAARLGIRRLYDLGEGGVAHQLLVEKGEVRPGMLAVCHDSHAIAMGAIGALVIPVFYDLATALALGQIWLRVPEVLQVNLTGRLRPGVTTRDMGQVMLATIGMDRANYRAIEYVGSAVAELSVGQRFPLSNLAIEVGAKAALVVPDGVAAAYVRARTAEPFELVTSDPDAEYAGVYPFDLGTIGPQVSVPPTPDCVVPIEAVVGQPIQQAFLGSCASGTIEDLRLAASVLSGRRVAPGVRLVVTPTTHEAYVAAAREGLLATIAEAGGVITAEQCGACFGATAPLGPGEVCISTSTRNDAGRMGDRQASIYLASAPTVAASAVAGKIVDPREFF